MIRTPLLESGPPVEIQELPSAPARRAVIGQEQSTTDLKIRVEVARQTDRLRRLQVGPLPVGAIHHLLKDRVGLDLSRPELVRLNEVTAALDAGRAAGLRLRRVHSRSRG